MILDKRLAHQIRSYWLTFFLVILISLAGALLTIFQTRILSLVINRAYLEHQPISSLLRSIGLLLLLISGRAIAIWVSDYYARRLAIQVKTKLRLQLYNHLHSLGPTHRWVDRSKENLPTGELTTLLQDGIETLDGYFSLYLPQLALAVLIPVTIIMFVFPVDLLSGIIFVLTAPLIPIFMYLISNQAERQTKKQWKALSWLSAYFLDVLRGLTTLKILGRSQAQIQAISNINEKLRQETIQVMRLTFLSSFVLELVATLSTAVIAVEVGLRLLYARISFEQALFVLLLAPEFYLPLRMLGARFHAGIAGTTIAEKIFSILAIRPILDDQKQPEVSQHVSETLFSKTDEEHSQVPQQATDFQTLPSIQFVDISYSYPDQRHALQGVTFEIKPGQRVALVGPSGSGKSTIAHLLLRFLEPQKGKIIVGSTDLLIIPKEHWLSQVAWLSQKPHLFNDTVASNLRLARPNASLDELRTATQMAFADEFIQTLPQGYETVIGENGSLLSSGQAQRLALARAFLKNAPLLILDEPTSYLDPDHEALVQQAITQLMKNRSTLTVAHRLNTVYQADQILVLSKGCIVQAGNHSALMAVEGLYKSLIQASQYTIRGIDASQGNKLVDEPDVTMNSVLDARIPLQDLSRAPLYFLTPQGSFLTQANSHPETTPLALSQSSTYKQSTPLLRLLWHLKPYFIWVVLSTVLGFSTIASNISLLAASAYLISAAALQPSIASLQIAIVAVRFFGISRGVFRYLERLVTHDITLRLISHLRQWFFQALEPLAPARLAGFRSGDLISRAISDITSLDNFFARSISPPLVAIPVTLAVTFWLHLYQPILAYSLLIFLAITGIGTPTIMSLLSHKIGAQVVMKRAALSSLVTDGIQGMAELLAFNFRKPHFEQVKKLSQEIASRQDRLARIDALQNTSGVLFSNLGMLIILVVGIGLVEQMRLEGMYLAVVVLVALSCYEALLPLPPLAQHLAANQQAAKRLFAIVDIVPSVQEPIHPLPLHQKRERTQTHTSLAYERVSLSVNDVSFCYPQTSKNTSATGQFQQSSTLDKISFSIPIGSKMAIVGPSGAGKTTLVNLILRFWNCTNGKILINDQDIQQFKSEDIHRLIGVVPQNSYLFNTTIRENLLISRPEASQAQMIQSAKHAQLHKFIQSLPLGYDTLVGEQGVRLSGGERQRVAIGRAFLKNPPFLILDEVTANLDTITEQKILQTIHTLMEGRTTLFITHRLVGMEQMDEILVLDKGQVVDRGKHASLIKRGGLYQRMWDLQNQIIVDQ